MKGFIEMLKRNWQFVAIILVLAGLGGLGFKSCDQKDKESWEKNARAAVRIGAAGAKEVKAEVDSYCRAELLTPESCDKAKPHLEKIVSISGKADKFLTEHPKITAANRGELFDLIDDAIAEIDALELEGVIEFENPDNRRKFLLTLAVSRSGLRVAKVALSEIDAGPGASPSPSPVIEDPPVIVLE